RVMPRPTMRRPTPHTWVVVVVAVAAVAAVACTPIKPKPKPPAPPPARTGDVNGSLGSCPVFPANNAWNTDVSGLPARTDSAQIIQRINSMGGDFLHADFGGGGAYGIPYVTVAGNEPTVPIRFTAYGDESDPGPYPVPLGAPIEGGRSSTGDRHVLAVNRGTCMLYELYRAFPKSGYWNA